MKTAKSQGFTMMETMVVMAITTSMTMIGFSTSRELLPRYRTRKAAMEFSRTLELARQLAITSSQETRVLMVEYDADALNPDVANRGRYLLQMGNAAAASARWDTLPYDETVGDLSSGEGTFDLSSSSSYYLKGVSIENWGTIAGPGSGNTDAIVFSPRGIVSNPSSDFDTDGTLNITFVNKYSMGADGIARARVRVFRGGMVRIGFDGAGIGGSGGSGFSTTTNNSTGDGYVDGGGGGGDDSIGGGDDKHSKRKGAADDIDDIVQEALDALNGYDGSDDTPSSDDRSSDDRSSDDRSDDGEQADDNGDASDGDQDENASGGSSSGQSDSGASDDGDDEGSAAGSGDPGGDPGDDLEAPSDDSEDAAGSEEGSDSEDEADAADDDSEDEADAADDDSEDEADKADDDSEDEADDSDSDDDNEGHADDSDGADASDDLQLH